MSVASTSTSFSNLIDFTLKKEKESGIGSSKWWFKQVQSGKWFKFKQVASGSSKGHVLA
jgi:hypothetical protein